MTKEREQFFQYLYEDFKEKYGFKSIFYVKLDFGDGIKYFGPMSCNFFQTSNSKVILHFSNNGSTILYKHDLSEVYVPQDNKFVPITNVWKPSDASKWTSTYEDLEEIWDTYWGQEYQPALTQVEQWVKEGKCPKCGYLGEFINFKPYCKECGEFYEFGKA